MSSKIPDITRLYKGAASDFEVEIVFAESGAQSPRESHEYDEIIVLTEGVITLERSDGEPVVYEETPAFIEIPAGVEHVINVQSTPAKLVVIHPDRNK